MSKKDKIPANEIEFMEKYKALYDSFSEKDRVFYAIVIDLGSMWNSYFNCLSEEGKEIYNKILDLYKLVGSAQS